MRQRDRHSRYPMEQVTLKLTSVKQPYSACNVMHQELVWGSAGQLLLAVSGGTLRYWWGLWAPGGWTGLHVQVGSLTWLAVRLAGSSQLRWGCLGVPTCGFFSLVVGLLA